MQALTFTRYGPPEKVLSIQDLPQPTPKENEVLVKIHATAVNDYDWSLVRGKPYIYRLMFGLFKPKNPVPGMELAGTVEAVGPGVRKFTTGNAVMGDTSDHAFGTFAEYLCVHEDALTHKPENMSFEEATAIPHASLLALQGLRDLGGIQAGQKVLLNGAGGGVGTLGLQLAKDLRCEVTGVDTGKKLETMRELGFDHLIDYKQEDFTRNGQHYDLILDCKTTRSPFAYLRSLSPNGKYVTVGGNLWRLLQLVLLRRILKALFKKDLKILPLKANKGLDYILELYQHGKLSCTIDGPYPLQEAPRLFQYFGEGKHTGKVVVKP